jgi:outer membrane protein assembly factor BamB
MGQVGDIAVAWQTEYRSPVSTDVATPLFYQGKFYVIADRRRAFSCVDPGTGKPVWTVDLPGSDAIWASPTGADGKVYLLTMAGEVVVVNATDGKVLATNKLVDGEMEIRSSIAVANGNLFVKTNTKLFCIGK